MPGKARSMKGIKKEGPNAERLPPRWNLVGSKKKLIRGRVLCQESGGGAKGDDHTRGVQKREEQHSFKTTREQDQKKLRRSGEEEGDHVRPRKTSGTYLPQDPLLAGTVLGEKKDSGHLKLYTRTSREIRRTDEVISSGKGTNQLTQGLRVYPQWPRTEIQRKIGSLR